MTMCCTCTLYINWHWYIYN